MEFFRHRFRPDNSLVYFARADEFGFPWRELAEASGVDVESQVTVYIGQVGGMAYGNRGRGSLAPSVG